MNTNRTLLIAGVILAISLIAGTSILLEILGRAKAQPIKIELVQPEDTIQIHAPKDTSSYYWSDNFSDAEIREMCEDGTLKLK